MESQPAASLPASPNTSTSKAHWLAIARQAVEVHKAQQDIQELAILLSFLAGSTIPALIIELGYGDGGLAWALRQLPSEPTVLSVTLPDPAWDHWRLNTAPGQHIITGDTQDPATLYKVIAWLGGQLADLLIIDADHTYNSAKHDYEDYSQLVKPDGLVIFHDIALALGYPDIQVHRLWQEIKASNYTTEIVSDPHGLAGIGILWGKRDPLH